LAPKPAAANKRATIEVDIEPIDIELTHTVPVGDFEKFIYQGLDYYLNNDSQVDFAAPEFGTEFGLDPEPQFGENVEHETEIYSNYTTRSEFPTENQPPPAREARKSAWVKVTKPANFSRAEPDLAK
jgi:hypothetical protein